jgi:hypothetical protein
MSHAVYFARLESFLRRRVDGHSNTGFNTAELGNEFELTAEATVALVIEYSEFPRRLFDLELQPVIFSSGHRRVIAQRRMPDMVVRKRA